MNGFCFRMTLIGLFVLPLVSLPAEAISLKSSITSVAPMTGIVLWSDHDRNATDAITLEFRYCGYDEIVLPDGSYDFTKLDRVLDRIASRGHQAVLRFRFVYPGEETTVPKSVRALVNYQETRAKSEGKPTSFCDWSHPGLEAFTLDFYERFATCYDHDPRIAFLQTGFGLWAEYHIYDGPRKLGKTFPSKSFQAKFLQHMHNCFESLPWSISVDAADFDYSPLENNAALLGLNFGVFDDSFLCKEHPKYNAANWSVLQSDRWRRAPGGGEFSYYSRRDQKLALSPQGPNGVSFENAVNQFHITYMIGNDQPEFQSMDRIRQAGMATGYRFRVIRAEAKVTGDRATVMIEATNEGVAPIYRAAYFAAGGKRASQSLQRLLPGQTQRYWIEAAPVDAVNEITIESDFILTTQTIPFEAMSH